MRIAFFSRSIPAHGGGGMERVAWDLMIALKDRGHSIVCYTTPHEAADSEGIDVRVINSPSGRYSKQWWSGSVNDARNFDGDAIISISAAAHQIVASGAFDGPVIMQAHGTARDELLTKWRVRTLRSLASMPKMALALIKDARLYGRYAAVVAVGVAVEQSLRSYPRFFGPQKVATIANGVSLPPPASDADRKQAKLDFGLDPELRCIGFVGRVHREKGADLLIDAVAGWNGQVLVVGAGPDLELLRQKAGGLADPNKVVLTGWADRKLITRAYLAADAVALPSRRMEGLPMVALEALSHGTAVIATEQITRNFDQTQTRGLTTVGADAESLREAINSACSATARGEVDLPSQYSIDFVAEQYETLLTGLKSK